MCVCSVTDKRHECCALARVHTTHRVGTLPLNFYDICANPFDSRSIGVLRRERAFRRLVCPIDGVGIGALNPYYTSAFTFVRPHTEKSSVLENLPFLNSHTTTSDKREEKKRRRRSTTHIYHSSNGCEKRSKRFYSCHLS